MTVLSKPNRWARDVTCEICRRPFGACGCDVPAVEETDAAPSCYVCGHVEPDRLNIPTLKEEELIHVI